MPSLCGELYALHSGGRRTTLQRIEYASSDDMDLIFIGIIVLFFAISGWLVLSLDKL
jgi:hypothetical protein